MERFNAEHELASWNVLLSSRGVLNLDETWYKFQRGPEGENHLSTGPLAQIGEERWCLFHCKICWRDNAATNLWPKRVGHWHSWVVALEPSHHHTSPILAMRWLRLIRMAWTRCFMSSAVLERQHLDIVAPYDPRPTGPLRSTEWSMNFQWSNLSRAAQHKGDGWA